MPKNLTPTETARQMGCTLDWIYRELRSGRLQGAVKIGKHWQIPAATVLQRLKQHEGRNG